MVPELGTTAPPSEVPPTSKPDVWLAFWQTLIKYDANEVDYWLGLRNALGVGAPLLVGLAIGELGSGAIAASGALNVCFSDHGDPYWPRARRMLIASVIVGLAVFTGATIGQNHGWAVALTLVWAFGAGLLVALSNSAPDLGMTSLVTLTVFSARKLPPDLAFLSGLLALAGGLIQTLFSVALWPVHRYGHERGVLAELFTELAKAAASPTPATQAPPASGKSTEAHQLLALRSADRSVEMERYRLMLSQAERMRLSILGLARLRVRLERDGGDGESAGVVERCFQLASGLFQALGEGLKEGDRAEQAPAQSLQEMQELANKLRVLCRDRASEVQPMVTDARFQVDALAGQFRTALDLLASTTPGGLEAFERKESRQPWALRFGGVLATLRANLTLGSAAFRHAVRLAVCVALGDAIGRGMGWERSYWLPMTIAIVLKPDFSATFSRGVQRLLGTFAGLVLATGLFHFAPSSPGAHVAMMVVFMFAMRSVGMANYGIFVAVLTGLVVLLVGFSGIAPVDVMGPRAINTAVGGLIALGAYWVWPTWEKTLAPEMVARMLDGYREYFRAVSQSYEQPGKVHAHDLDRARVAARRVRSNLEASVDRLSAEPRTSQATVSALQGILASSHRMVHAVMSLEAGLARSHPVAPRKPFPKFAKDVELTLYYLAAALRGSPLKATDLPDLREDHHELVNSGDALTERYALVNVETDRITNSLNTLSGQILRWLGRTESPSQPKVA